MGIDHFSTATDMLAALDAKEISSVELTELHISRIEAIDRKLLSIAVRTFDRARTVAAEADRRRASGETAPLLGLPMTLKESTQVAGLPQTAGLAAFEGYRPESDGVLAAHVFDAGAALLGKTNVPVALGDWQADSPVYGRTNNPWDVTRTPGGSTGGGGAALAAGLTPLEIGSDIGGSIRVPAAYCGVFGHRPSETAIPQSGAFPMADLPNQAFLMGVQGPLARSVDDLVLLFDVVSGPDRGEDAGWKLGLPQPRHTSLRDFRVAVLPQILGLTPARAVRNACSELAQLLRSEGATVQTAQPDIDMDAYFRDYARTLSLMTSQGMPPEDREAQAEGLRRVGNPIADAQADGFTMGAHDFILLVGRREFARVQWRQFFREWDVVIAPMTLDSAFPHQTRPFAERTLVVDGVELPYFSNIIHSMIAIFPGLPSTAFPAGLDDRGLPIGMQAIGPYLGDRTTLEFARLVERAWHRFQPPPGY